MTKQFIAYWRIQNLKIKVYILEKREVYGRTDFFICPVKGKGQQWVSSDKVEDIIELPVLSLN